MLYHLLLYGYSFLGEWGWGLNVGPGLFSFLVGGGGGVVLSPGIFLGFHFCPHSNIPVT